MLTCVECSDITDAHPELNLSVYVCDGGTLYAELAIEAAQKGPTSWRPLVILAPLRLGIEALNPTYVSCLLRCFEITQCIGMAGYVRLKKPCHDVLICCLAVVPTLPCTLWARMVRVLSIWILTRLGHTMGIYERLFLWLTHCCQNIC